MFSPTATVSPFRTIAPFSGDMDELFARLARPVSACGFPAINVRESESAITIESELPGFTQEEIDVTFLGRELTIQGEHVPERPEGAKAINRERPSRSFARTLRVSAPIEAERVTAVLKDGLLTVTLPKIAAVQPRKIAVTP